MPTTTHWGDLEATISHLVLLQKVQSVPKKIQCTLNTRGRAGELEINFHKAGIFESSGCLPGHLQ